jgi:hypothetical protein
LEGNLRVFLQEEEQYMADYNHHSEVSENPFFSPDQSYFFQAMEASGILTSGGGKGKNSFNITQNNQPPQHTKPQLGPLGRSRLKRSGGMDDLMHYSSRVFLQ